jgi:NAD(P)-dependent dehydrogenase (short-subunit alcohol dehydrogenase family)
MMGSGLFRLDGKRALVTGAGRGIGRAVAFGLAEFGAQVTLCARTATEIEQAAEEIRKAGGRAEAFVQDVTDVEGFARTIATQPAFDILVNNAGTNRPKPLSDVTIEDYRAVMELNLKAVIFVTQVITRRMAECGTKGSVINMSSQMGHVGAANRTLYCASKWALEGFTRALAIELGPLGIRVNTICPTFIETPMTEPYFRDEAFRRSVLSKIKLGRLGRVEDVVGAAVYLASEASALMTGSALMLDGGWTAD